MRTKSDDKKIQEMMLHIIENKTKKHVNNGGVAVRVIGEILVEKIWWKTLLGMHGGQRGSCDSLVPYTFTSIAIYVIMGWMSC